MSREQEYFPPAETKFKWWPKALNHSPWGWPADVTCYVSLVNNKYHWTVNVNDWRGNKSDFHGEHADALGACLEAEKVGEAEVNRLFPDWVVTALENKWRPPFI